MDESIIMKGLALTVCGSGPSSLCRRNRILTSCAFGTATVDLRQTYAQLIKKLCVEELGPASSWSIKTWTKAQLV